MSDNWIRVCAVSELLPGEYQVVWDGDTPIAVFNIEGTYYAVEDTCTHDGGELAGGELQGFEVVCPRHGARFDLRDGAVTAPPAV
jgi:3-phenylpropionate/trans-cinnamate dioxygenase ferredoxin subunit